MLKRVEGPVSGAIFEILRVLDAKFSLDRQSMNRCQFCKMCLLDGKYGYFPLKEGIQITSAHVRCSRLKHSMDKSLYEIMDKPCRLEMATPRNDLGNETFEESDIKTNFLEEKPDTGN